MLWPELPGSIHSEWLPWFAWYPVRVSNGLGTRIAWLRKVYRHCIAEHMEVCIDCGCSVKYREG